MYIHVLACICIEWPCSVYFTTFHSENSLGLGLKFLAHPCRTLVLTLTLPINSRIINFTKVEMKSLRSIDQLRLFPSELRLTAIPRKTHVHVFNLVTSLHFHEVFLKFIWNKQVLKIQGKIRNSQIRSCIPLITLNPLPVTNIVLIFVAHVSQRNLPYGQPPPSSIRCPFVIHKPHEKIFAASPQIST